MSVAPRLLRLLALVAVSDASVARAQKPELVSAAQVTLARAKAVSAGQPKPPLVERAKFLIRQRYVDVSLSPDGTRVSFVRRDARGADVVLYDLASGKEGRVAAGLQRIETAWSGDGRRLWIADAQGLSVVVSRGGDAKRIFKWDRRRKQQFWAVDRNAPQYAIVHERVTQSGSERHRYLRLDDHGASRLLLESALPLHAVLLDRQGELAFTSGFEGQSYETVLRQHSPQGAREVLRCKTIETCRLVGYNQASRTLWALSEKGVDRLALRRWREASGQWETVHSDPDHVADLDAIVWNTERQDWMAVAYYGGHRRWYAKDAGTTAVLGALARRIPGANLRLSPATDGRVWLVQAQQADLPTDRYFLYRPGSNTLQQLFASPKADEPVAPRGVAMHPISYRASDGMLLHGYVVLPSGVVPSKAPLIAWLHGGPTSRMYDRYDGGIQLLASRGYAVFVPNFRGSTGYGLSYVLSARGDLAKGRVLADVIEGLDVVLGQGIGDPTRQGVMGLSFGGYASLLAASHFPGRFRVVFAGTPPTDYGWNKQWQVDHERESPPEDGPPLVLQYPILGFRYNDPAWRERMRRESPLEALPLLQAPVYIWAGARDERVPLKSVVHYVGEGRRLGKRMSLLIDPDAGHGPESEIGVEASLYFLELAAHRHFGGGLSPLSKELQAFLSRNVRGDGEAPR